MALSRVVPIRSDDYGQAAFVRGWHVLRGEILPSRVFDRDELAPLPTELVGHHAAVEQCLKLRDVPIALLFRGEREV